MTKVHFASIEEMEFAILLNEVVGVKYALFSVYKFICDEFNQKPRYVDNYTTDIFIKYFDKFKHSIMDSGLFTLMFGSQSGTHDEASLRRWLERIVEFVQMYKYRGTVVEVDCQKVLGVEQAWKFRKVIRKLLPSHEIINVYHLEDGKYGLDKLIDWSNYIAISVPELRKVGVPNIETYIAQQAHYIKQKKPGIKIHLLGCTQPTILRVTKFCDSSDSIAWRSGTVFKSAAQFRNGKLKKIDYSIVRKKVTPLMVERMYNIMSRYPLKLTEKMIFNLCINEIMAKEHLACYEHNAGSQD